MSTPIEIPFSDPGADEVIAHMEEMAGHMQTLGQLDRSRLADIRKATIAINSQARAYERLNSALSGALSPSNISNLKVLQTIPALQGSTGIRATSSSSRAAPIGMSTAERYLAYGQRHANAGNSAQAAFWYEKAFQAEQRQRQAQTPNHPPLGPASQLQKARDAFAAAQQSGTSVQIQDAALKLAQKQRSFDLQMRRMTPPNSADLLTKMVNSSRLAIGPNGQMQAMPIAQHFMALMKQTGGGTPNIGGMLNMAGGAGSMASAGPFAAIAAGIAVVTGGFVMAVKGATDRLNAQANIMFMTGASAHQAAMGQRMGTLLGFDFASRASAFGDMLNGGGVQAAYARRLGINPVGNLMGQGDQNFAGKFIKAMERLLDPNKTTDRQARLYAKAFGMGDMLWARNLSPGNRRILMDQHVQEQSPERMRMAADMQFQLNLAMKLFQDVLMNLGITVLPLAIKGLVWLSDRFMESPFVRFFAKDAFKEYWAKGGTSENMHKAIDEFDKAKKEVEGAKKKSQDGHAQAMDRHAAAMNQHAQAMNGIHGGGDHARRALPGGWGPQQINDAVRGAITGLGEL